MSTGGVSVCPFCGRAEITRSTRTFRCLARDCGRLFRVQVVTVRGSGHNVRMSVTDAPMSIDKP